MSSLHVMNDAYLVVHDGLEKEFTERISGASSCDVITLRQNGIRNKKRLWFDNSF